MINAMIRVGTMPEKERLFIAFIDGHRLIESKKRGAKGQLEEVAVESARECGNAKNKQDRIKEQAVEQLEIKIFNDNLLDNKILFVELDESDDYPSTLTGLIAMQLSAKYKKPTIVAREGKDGIVKGSARGLSNSELKSFKTFMSGSGFFEYAQGHDNACGCGIASSKLNGFHDFANEFLSGFNFNENAYDVNFIRDANDKDIKNLVLDLHEGERYWGQENPEPLIYIEKVPLSKASFRIMGANEDTIKIEYNGISYMKFKAKKFIEELEGKKNGILNLVGRPNLNEWGGKQIPQIFIEDYEIIA
jgi:single-stranded-DNA-specific exonuclease